MKQFGGGLLGGVALAAGTMTPQPFTALPVGPVAALLCLISFTLISTGGGFALVVDTGGASAAEGTDDMDIFLTNMFSNVQLYADPDTSQANFDLVKLRTILGYFNVKDYGGSFVNGATVPAAGGGAKAFNIAIQIPYALKNLMPHDGAMFHQGSTRLKTGRLEITSGASLTPNLVFAGGTATVGGMKWETMPLAGSGTENDVAPIWQVTRPGNTLTVYDFDPGDYLFIASQSLAAAIGDKPIIIGPYENLRPSMFVNQFQDEQLTYGGFDVTNRCTPLMWVNRHRRFEDMMATVGEVVHVDFTQTSIAQPSWITAKLLPVSPKLSQAIAQTVGAGGTVSAAPIAPPSRGPIPSVLAHLSPQRIVPGSVAAAGATSHSPASLASAQGAKLARASAQHALLKGFKR